MKTKKHFLKIKTIILTSIYFIVVGLLLLYIGFELGFPDKTAKYMQFKVNNVITESMEPKVKRYDAIVITNFKTKNLKKGNIITFKKSLPTYNQETGQYGTSLEYVTHRITEVIIDENGNYTFKTKGDNNIVVDSWTVKESEIIGKYLFKIPKAGYLMLFLKSWIGIIIIIFNVGVIITIVYLLKKDKKHNEEEVKKHLKEPYAKSRNNLDNNEKNNYEK